MNLLPVRILFIIIETPESIRNFLGGLYYIVGDHGRFHHNSHLVDGRAKHKIGDNTYSTNHQNYYYQSGDQLCFQGSLRVTGSCGQYFEEGFDVYH
jgi:hypothetical protein